MPDFFIGLWPIFWKNAGAGGAVVALLAFAYFSPVFKKTALWCALAVASHLIAYNIGVDNGRDQEQKRLAVGIEREAIDGETARTNAERAVRAEPPAGVRNDTRNRDNWK